MARLIAGYSVSVELRGTRSHAKRASGFLLRFAEFSQITEPEQITAASAEQWGLEQTAAGRSAKTIRNQLSVLSGFCIWLVRRGILPDNPCRLVALPRLHEPNFVAFTEHECRIALRVALKHGCRPEICLALTTGLRLSEMARLFWADVDLEGRVLKVRKSKSGHPRIVPLSKRAIGALRRQKIKTGKLTWVFPARRTCRSRAWLVDRQRSLPSWLRLMRPVQEAIPRLGQLGRQATGRAYHAFRHTFITRLLADGISIYKVAKWAGHRDIRQTERYARMLVVYDPDIERLGTRAQEPGTRGRSTG